jgi:hypothetical protein
MKTLKIGFMIFAALIVAGFGQLNAQVLQEKDLEFYFCGWVGCANNGQGEDLCGTVHQHAVTHFDKDGNISWYHFNYDKSVFIGSKSGEVFTMFGASNMGILLFSTNEFNETIQLRGDKGTKVVVKTKYHYTPENEFVMDLFFEKCNK